MELTRVVLVYVHNERKRFSLLHLQARGVWNVVEQTSADFEGKFCWRLCTAMVFALNIIP